MPMEVWQGLLIPFAGTTLGAACVFFMRNHLRESVQRVLTGFAAGVMVAASIWSLLLPAMEQAAGLGPWSFVPAVALPYALSFAAGAMIYVVVVELIPEMSAGKHSNLGTLLFAAGFTLMMTLDVALG